MLLCDAHALFSSHVLATQGVRAGNAAPKWQVFPPRALDQQGVAIEPRSGGSPLSAYEIRAEYVCLSLTGCVPRIARIRIAHYGLPDEVAPQFAPFMPVPAHLLQASSGEPETARRAMYRAMERGWGTYDRASALRLVTPLPMLDQIQLHSFPIVTSIAQRLCNTHRPPLLAGRCCPNRL